MDGCARYGEAMPPTPPIDTPIPGQMFRLRSEYGRGEGQSLYVAKQGYCSKLNSCLHSGLFSIM